MSKPIITVGISPVWDITNYVGGIEWGDHKVVSSQTIIPAGKPLNISKALARMNVKSIVSGLWGESDYPQLVEGLPDADGLIDLRLTVVQGITRQNITIVDTLQNREMHLRAQSTLTTKDNLKMLKEDLSRVINPDSVVVFAGSMPDGPLFRDCQAIVQEAVDVKAEVVIDTSGSALSSIVNSGGIGIIKPNQDELSGLLDREFADDIPEIINGARALCDRVGIILVSLGAKGALAVTSNQAIYCKVEPTEYKVVNTVSCGDYFLAGFLSESGSDICRRLQNAVKLASARAWGVTEKNNQVQIQKIKVQVKEF